MIEKNEIHHAGFVCAYCIRLRNINSLMNKTIVVIEICQNKATPRSTPKTPSS